MGWLGLNDYLVIEAAARARLDDLTRVDNTKSVRTVGDDDEQSHEHADDGG